MLKVKIFTSTIDGLDKDINEWLKQNEEEIMITKTIQSESMFFIESTQEMVLNNSISIWYEKF